MALLDSILDPLIGSPPSAPAAPDYTGAAEATAAGNLENAQLATVANRPGQFNPYGSSVWAQNPDGTWRQDISFSPEQQNLYNQSTARQSQILNQSAPSFEGARGSVMDAMLKRVDTDIARDRETERSRLIAQGIPPGSEAYKREMENIDRKQTDARQQAEINATEMARKEYSADLAGRNVYANEAARFTPSQPTFNQFYNQQAVPGPDYSGATGAQGQFDMGVYNSQQQQYNNMVGGLFDLGAAALSGPF